jgi:hypothetical protein
MTDRWLADAVVLFHFAFIVFVLAGGLLVLQRTWWAALHLPAAAWGAYTEFTATICPLTPLENALRRSAGQAGYEGGFVEQYLIPVIYPAGLTPALQLWLGLAVVAVNAIVYAVAWRRRARIAAGRSGVR